MTEIEQDILGQLNELDRLVRTMKSADPKPNLIPVFTRLDELARALPPGSDTTLRHYLHNKSYEKARLYLQGRDAENARGNCGR